MLSKGGGGGAAEVLSMVWGELLPLQEVTGTDAQPG